MESPEVNIALLGFTQTGKTCIAADLSDLTGVSPVNKFSQDFVKDNSRRISKMRNGDWSDPVSPTLTGLHTKLKFRNDKAVFSFCDYAGEKLIKDIETLKISDQDGFLLLLSAREPIAGGETRKKNIRDAFGLIAKELRHPENKNKPVKLVITAADVLLEEYDHTEFYNLKQEVEKIMADAGVKISETRYVSIVTSSHGNCIPNFDFKSEMDKKWIEPTRNPINDMVDEIRENKTKKMIFADKIKRICLAAAAILVIAALIWLLPGADRCHICGNEIKDKKHECPACETCGSVKNIGHKCFMCDDHRTVIVNGSCQNCITEFDALKLSDKIDRFDNLNVPADRLLNDIAAEWEKTFSTPRYGNKEYFDNLRIECRKIRNIENDEIKKSKISEFARGYEKYYKQPATVQLTSLKFRKAKDRNTPLVMEYFQLFINGKKVFKESKAIKITAETEEQTHIFDNVTVTMTPRDSIAFWYSWDTHRFAGSHHSTRKVFDPFKSGKHEVVEKGSGFDYVNLECKIAAGETFPALLNRVFRTETPNAAAIKGAATE